MMSKRKGFTLIELLVVIAIIGILAGIILTVIYVAKQKARVAAGKGMLSSIPAAWALCVYNGGQVEPNDPGEPKPPTANSYICSDPTITDAKYPDLGGSGWWYGDLFQNENSVWFTAICNAPQCGIQKVATCSLDIQLSQNGCTFGSE